MAESSEIMVLCKTLSENSDKHQMYVDAVKNAGYTCECLQPLRFEFVNISELRTCLSTADNYSGLILTSPRTVQAIALAVKEDSSILHSWKHMPTYCVGPSTDSCAQDQLNLECCIGSESGNAKRLAEQIIREVEKDSKPLLYPCSEIARETILPMLSANGRSVQKIVVYKTLKNELLEQDLSNILEKSPSIFVFFSPSIVKYIVEELNKNNIKDLKAVAIGPATRDALIKSGLNVYATAEKPEPTSMICAITTAERMQDSSENAP